MASWTQYPPRIQFKRRNYQVLADGWTLDGKEIKAPWDFKTSAEKLCYECTFTLGPALKNDKVRTMLHFEAVDQVCSVFVNDVAVGQHEGGYLPFAFDISSVSVPGENTLCVEVTDTLDTDLPYGKQCKRPHGMWYTPVSGIWQPVWLEAVPRENEIRSIRITPNLTGIDLEVDTDAEQLSVRVYSPHSNFRFTSLSKKLRIHVPEPHPWTPEDPYLYDIFLDTEDDHIQSYFALRTVSMEEVDGHLRFCLNGQPLFLHGVLDQGYWGKDAYLPASYQAYLDEARAMKALGFNCIRKHIKIENEAFYYFCDYTGLLVIQDMVNSGKYSFLRDTALPFVFGNCLHDDRKKPGDKKRRERFEEDMRQTMAHLYNHPCVVGYTLFNEGWGQFESDRMYRLAKELDPTRFIDSTSGWFAQNESDVQSEHIFFRSKQLKANGADRFLLLSECGGYTRPVEGHVPGDKKKYGYGEADTEEALTAKIEDMYRKMVLPSIPDGLCGCIYTQNADVEGEVNGLYTADRQVCKVDAERMRAIAEEIISTAPYTPREKRSLKTVRVVAAVIHSGSRIYATQRGYGEFKDGWEFPGGKIEDGETPEEAIVREIREELDVEVEPEFLITTVEYDYPKFHLSMDCFACKISKGHPRLLEHEAARWLSRKQLDEVAWLPADITLVEKIRREWETIVSEQIELPQPLNFSDMTFER